MGFLIGVSVVSVKLADNMFFYLSFLLLVLVFRWMGEQVECSKKQAGWVLGIAFLVGVLRMLADIAGVGYLAEFNGMGLIEMRAEVAAVPLIVENNQTLFLEVSEVRQGDNQFQVNGYLKLKLPRYPQYLLGEELELKGELEIPDKQIEDFKYADYLAKDRVYSVVKNPQVRLLEQQNWWSWPEKIIWEGHKIMVGRLNQIFAEPAAGIVAGILVGERSSIDQEILKNFQVVGLTHILAISGFNITLIINVVTLLLAGLSRRRRFGISLFLIILFVFLTGCSASVVRAAVMGMMILLIKLLGRKAETLNVILLTSALLVFFSPHLLNFDLSFQLSFLATLSLVLYADQLDDLAKSWPDLIKEGVLVTLSAQVLTLPITFYNFGSISLIAPLANLLILPLIPALMLCSFGSFLLSPLSLTMAKWTGGISWVMVQLMVKVVQFLAKIPLAALSYGRGMIWLVLLYYYLVFKLFHKQKSVLLPSVHPVLPDESVSN